LILPERYTINKETGCWEWRGYILGGYGISWHNGKTHKAHRASYEKYKGDIPDGLLVCHSCDNPRCINPDHLWLGTQSDNMKDAVSKGRVKIPSRKGRENTPEHKRKVGEANTGKKKTEELKRKISIDIKKRWDSGEMKGFTGRKHSEESKRKKSESMKLYWEKKRADMGY